MGLQAVYFCTSTASGSANRQINSLMNFLTGY